MKWLWCVMTMSVYIRFGLETYLFMTISVVSELKEFDTTTDFKTYSLITCIAFGVWLAVLVIWGIYSLNYKDTDDLGHNMNIEPIQTDMQQEQTPLTSRKKWCSREFTSGLKTKIFPRLFIIIFMVSRLSFVLLIVVFSSLPTIVKTIVF